MATFKLATLACVFVLAHVLECSLQHCTSRKFSNYNGTVINQIDNRDCPYQVYADPWTPGQRVAMELANIEERPFQLFLVSVQLGNSLIGRMIAEDNEVMTTCRGTSVQHADLSDKPVLSFEWEAPSDINATQVIIRTSVGTDELFWKDCEAFFLERAFDGGLDSNVPTTRIVPTTTHRVANPDTANNGNGDTTQNTEPKASCTQHGNLYTVVAGSDCKKYIHSVEGSGVAGTEMPCPSSTRFDVSKCACSFMKSEDCGI